MVDPYDWLGLPKSQRPPTHYQLLGLAPGEADDEVIAAAGDVRLDQLLEYLDGPHAHLADRLSQEVQEAVATLTDPDRRAMYDALTPGTAPPAGAKAWWQEAGSEEAKPAAGNAWWKEAPPAEEFVPAPPPPTPAVSMPSLPTPEPIKVRRARPRKSPVVPVVAGVVLVAGLVGLAIFLGSGKKKTTESVASNDSGRTDPDTRPKVDPTPKDVDEPPPAKPLPVEFVNQLRARTYRGHSGPIMAISVNPTGTRFATIGTDRAVRVWSPQEDASQVRHTFRSPGVGLAFANEGKKLVACDGLTVALLDVDQRTLPKELESPRGGVYSLAATADASHVLTGLSDGYLRWWDTASGQPDEWPVVARGRIDGVSLSPDGALAAAIAGEAPVSVWRLASKGRVQDCEGHMGGTASVAFAPDSKRIATGGVDGTAAVHDLAAKKIVCRIPGHSAPVRAVAWLADGRRLVTIGADATARMWDAQTGYPLPWSHKLSGVGICVAIDPQERFVLVGTDPGVVDLLPLPRVKPEAPPEAVAKAPAEPLAVPEASLVKEALAAVQTELARDFGFDRPDDRSILADNLRRRGFAPSASPATRFALFREAARLAALAGDPALASRAVDDLSAWFDVDGLAEQAGTFTSVSPEADAVALVGVGLVLAERAEGDVRPEAVAQILARLKDVPTEGLSETTSNRLAALQKRHATAQAEIKAVRAAMATLKLSADVPAANQTVGEFLCLTRQDWATGLKHLQKGIASATIDAARLDLDGASDPKGQIKIADRWMSVASDMKDPRYQRAMRGRARTWYERAVKGKPEVADGFKAQSRLQDIQKLDVPPKDPTALPLLTAVLVRRGYNTIAPAVLANEWQLDAGATASPDGVKLPEGSPALHSRFGLAIGGQLTLTVRGDGRDIRVFCAGQEAAFSGAGKQVRLTIERTEAGIQMTAAGEGDPARRTMPLPPTVTQPLPLTLRLTGTVAGTPAVLTAAMLRGPASLPVPNPE